MSGIITTVTEFKSSLDLMVSFLHDYNDVYHMTNFGGKVKFRSPKCSVRFQEFSFVPRQIGVDIAEICIKENHDVELTLTLSTMDNCNSAIQVAQEVADSLPNMLAYHLLIPFSNFELCEHNFSDLDLKVPNCQIGEYLHVEDRIVGCRVIGITQIQELISVLEKPNSSCEVFYEQFRIALAMGDPVSKFMILYGILLGLCDDNQERVDKFVLSVQPGISTNPPYRERKSSVLETAYTRLRNEICHRLKSVAIETVKEDISAILDGLIQVVQFRINKQQEA